jgi:hypothetical protein
MAMPGQHNKLLEAVKVIFEQGFSGMGEAMYIAPSRYLQAEP